MATKNPPRFDHLWHDAVAAYGQLQKYTRRLGKNVKEVRRYTYRFAVLVKEMTENHHNEFLAMVTGEGANVTQWFNERFELIEAMGDTRERIFQAIAAGVTEREYVTEGEIVLCRKRIDVTSKPKDVAEPSAPREDAPLDQKLTHALAVVENLRSIKQTLRRDNTQLRKDLAIALRRIDKLERALKRAEKTIDMAIKAG